MIISKELFLVRRVILSALCVIAARSMMGFGSLSSMTVLFGLIFGFSFLFQYFVLHFALKQVTPTPMGRLVFLICWAVLSLGVASWAMYEMATFDWLQQVDTETIVRQYIWRITVFQTAAASFVGGSCARVAFDRHGQLDLPKSTKPAKKGRR